jgi:O-antigen ligase
MKPFSFLYGAGLGLVCLVPALFGSLLPSFWETYSSQRLLGCLLFWGLSCLALLRLVLMPRATLSWMPVLAVLPFALFMLSGELYPATYHVEPALFFFFFLGSALLGGGLSRTPAALRFVQGGLLVGVACALFYGLLSLLHYVFALWDGVTKFDRAVSWGFPNIRYWSHVATWLIPLLALAQCVRPVQGLPLARGLVFIAGGLWWWVLLTTAGRGSLLGLVAGAVWVSLLWRDRAFPLVRALGSHVLLGAGVWLVLTVAVPLLILGTASPRAPHVDSSGRGPLWLEAWNMSLVHVPLGMGPQSWLTHEPMTEAYRQSQRYGHPHNMYLYWAAEYGWLSILAFLLMVAGAMNLVFRSRSQVGGRDGALLLPGFLMSVTAGCVHAAFSAVFIAPASMLAGFFVITCFWALASWEGAEAETQKKGRISRPWLWRMLAGMALIVLLVWGSVWQSEIRRYHEDHRLDRQTYRSPGSIGTPRFWSHGDFPRQ